MYITPDISYSTSFYTEEKMSEDNEIRKTAKLTEWSQKHPMGFFIAVGTVLWELFFSAALWSWDFDHETIYIPRGSFNPWLFLGLPFHIGIGMGLSSLLYLLKFISRKLAWSALFVITGFAFIAGIWGNLPQNCFVSALGTEYHKDMKLYSLKTFHAFNNSDEMIAGKFYFAQELICDKPLKVASNRQVVLKKAGNNIYEFESRFVPVSGSEQE